MRQVTQPYTATWINWLDENYRPTMQRNSAYIQTYYMHACMQKNCNRQCLSVNWRNRRRGQSLVACGKK